MRAALSLYQEGLRRPSASGLLPRLPGSMQGTGESSLKAAMSFVLTPSEASAVLVQHGPEDQIFVLPFDSDVRAVFEGRARQRIRRACLMRSAANKPTTALTSIAADCAPCN